MFGMRPLWFYSFNCTPRMPKECDHMALRNIHSFGNVFDLEIKRAGTDNLDIIIKNNNKENKLTIRDGATAKIKL